MFRPRTQTEVDEPHVNANLMQNYRLESPVSVSGDIEVVQTPDGKLSVLSTGSGGKVFCFQSSGASDTGWTQTQLPLQGSQVAAGITNAGTLIVITPSGNTLAFVEQDAAGNWGAPQTLVNAIGSPISHVKARTLAGQLYVTIFYSTTATPSSPPFQALATVWDGQHTVFSEGFAPTFLLDSFGVEPFLDAQGGVVFYTSLTPQLYRANTNQYDPTNLYIDRGSGAKMYLSLWRPIPPQGFYNIGDYAVGGWDSSVYNYPSGYITCLASVDDPLFSPLLVEPIHFDQTWNDRQSQAGEDGATWSPRAPSGYCALGHVATRGYDPPATSIMRCVRVDRAAPATAYIADGSACPDDEKEVNCNTLMIFNNLGKKGGQELAIDRIDPGSDGLRANTFFSHNSWAQPQGQVYAQAANPALFSRLYTSAAGGGATPQYLLPDLQPQFQRVAMAPGPGGTAGIFAIFHDGSLKYLNPASLAWETLDRALKFLSLSAALNGSGYFEVFAISTDRHLYYVAQTKERNGDWDQVIEMIPEKQFVSVETVSLADGVVFALGVTTDNLLYSLFKDPETGQWMTGVVEYQATHNIVEVNTYTTEITITDLSGTARPGALVKVWAENTTEATINGRSYFLDPVTHVPCTSNAAALVSVVVETSSLYAPMLKYWTEFMPEGTYALAEPNWRIQRQLRVVTGETLDKEFGITVGDAIAPYINDAMSLVPTRSKGGAFYYQGEGFPNHVDASAIAGRPFQLDFSSGRPVYRTLTAQEVADITARTATLPDLGDADWLDDLGDLVQGVIDDVVSVATITVDAVKDGVRAVMDLVMQGVHYAYTVTVSLVEQAFDLVECVFAQVKIAFDRLFDWLGFVFDWQNILRTHDAVKVAFQQSLQFVRSAAQDINQDIQEQIRQIREVLENDCKAFLDNVLGQSGTLFTFQRDHAADNPVLSGNTGANIVFSAFMDNPAAAVSRRPPRASSITGDDPVSQLLEKVKALASQFSSGREFEDALAYFGQIETNPDQALELAFAGMVSLLAAAADAALGLAGVLVDALFAAIDAVLNFVLALMTEPWEIPFLSDLYSKYINPNGTLNALDLFSLIVAIPANVAYSALYNAAPFPDQAAVKDFEDNFTAEWLLDKARGGKRRSRSLPRSEPWRDGLSKVFGAVYAGSFFFYAPIEAALDAIPPDTKDVPPQLSQAAIALETLGWVFSCPWAMDPTNDAGTDCSEGGQAFGNNIWAGTGWVAPVLDGGVYMISEAAGDGVIMRNLSDATLTVDWLWATVEFGLVCAQQAKGTYTTSLQSAQAFLGSVPGLFKFLRYSRLYTGSKGITGLALAAVDVIGDESAAIMQLAMGSAQPRPQVAAV